MGQTTSGCDQPDEEDNSDHDPDGQDNHDGCTQHGRPTDNKTENQWISKSIIRHAPAQ